VALSKTADRTLHNKLHVNYRQNLRKPMKPGEKVRGQAERDTEYM